MPPKTREEKLLASIDKNIETLLKATEEQVKVMQRLIRAESRIASSIEVLMDALKDKADDEEPLYVKFNRVSKEEAESRFHGREDFDAGR